jgi:hypothetical protein
MSRRVGFGSINNGVAQNGRAVDHPGHLDPSRGLYPYDTNLISSAVPRERQVYYQGLSDVHNLPQAASGVKFSNFNNAVRSPNVNPNLSSLPNGQTWSRVLPYQNSQERPSRYPLNSAAGNGNLSAHCQNQPPNQQKQPYQHRRQNQSLRPQVRLPCIPDDDLPKNDILQSTQVNRDFYTSSSDLKIRSIPPPSQPNDIQSKQYNFGRHHKNSISSSSRTSTENNSYSTDLAPSKPSSQASEDTPCNTSSSHRRPRPSYSPEDVDKEWLLLREETMRRPRDPPRDKYAHVHPIVRKYAAHTIPEVKMGEPQRANSVMSRRWQEEENLEPVKREEGIDPPPRPATCMTEQEHKANHIAQLTLAMLREFDEKSQENIDEEKSVASEKAE